MRQPYDSEIDALGGSAEFLWRRRLEEPLTVLVARRNEFNVGRAGDELEMQSN